MNNSSSQQDRIRQVFFPHTEKKLRQVKAESNRFAYYTTAEVAAKILTERKVWMRNTMTMNDYMEVEHGFECLNAAYKAEPGQHFNAALDSCYPGLAEEVLQYFKAWLPSIRGNTFITCVSEHTHNEDEHGRLSMWRAYGGRAGIALVLNGAVFFSDTEALGAYSSPVMYMRPQQFAQEVLKVAKGMEDEVEFIKSLGRERVKQLAFNMLRFAVLCTKHPGFHEEREWRVVASPVMHLSKLLSQSVETVRGTPQIVLKINLENEPDVGLVGLELPELLDRIIIGPCEFPEVIFRAMRQLLHKAGISSPEERLVISGIPLRHG
jgi:Protein of unknown function (DUF2971)